MKKRATLYIELQPGGIFQYAIQSKSKLLRWIFIKLFHIIVSDKSAPPVAPKKPIRKRK